MGASVRPDSTDPLVQLMATKGQGSDPLAQLLAQKQKATTLHDGSQATAGVIPSALDAMTFGLSQRGVAGIGALKDATAAKLHGGEFGKTFAEAYPQNLAAQHAAAAQYHEAHPALDTGAQLVGGIGGIAATGGMGVGPDALNATRLARWGGVLKAGAKYGAASGVGHSEAPEQGRGLSGVLSDAGHGALSGMAGAALSIPATAVGGKLLSAAGIPGLVAKAAGAVGDVLPQGSSLQRGAQALSGAFGPNGQANQVIARKAAADEGYPIPEPHPSLPRIGLDKAGPNVEGLAENMANKPGPARATIVNTLEQRQKLMRPAITNELEQGTGVKASERLGPLKDAVTTRSAADATNYPAAFEATKDQRISSPSLDKIAQTATGKKAFAWAGARQSNLVPDLADGVTPPDPSSHASDLYDKLLKLNGGDAAQAKAGLKALGYKDNVINPRAGATAGAGYDPQTVHLVKRYLAHVAKLGMDDGQQGIAAAEAHGAMGLWGNVRSELPAEVRAADEVSAKNARLVDATNTGRKIFQARINPPTANAAKALNTSLGEVDARNAAASPEEQQALQRGSAMAAHAKLLAAPSSVKAPGRVFNQSPEQVEQLGHAFPSPDKATDFQGAVQSWDKAAQQAERLTGNSRTGLRKNLGEDTDLMQPGMVFARSPKTVLRSVVNKINNEYEVGKQAKLDGTIAKLLMSPDGDVIQKASAAGVTRSKLLQAIGLAGGGEGAEQATDRPRKP